MFPNRLFPRWLFADRLFPPGEPATVPEQPEIPEQPAFVPSTGGGDLTRLLAKRGEEPFLGLLREVVAEVDLFLLPATDYATGREEDAEVVFNWGPAAAHTSRVVHVAGVLIALDASGLVSLQPAHVAEGSFGLDSDAASQSAPQSREDEWLLTDDLLGLL